MFNAGDVSEWIEHIELQAKFERVISETVAQDRCFDGSDHAEQVDHEEQLYLPIAHAIYGPANQAARLLGLPLRYTSSRGMLISGNVMNHAAVPYKYQCLLIVSNVLSNM